MDNLRYYLPGIILILIAVIIVAVPEIIVAFLAAVIIMAGIAALYIGHRVRKAEIEFRSTDHTFTDEGFFGSRFLNRPFFRDWRRWF